MNQCFQVCDAGRFFMPAIKSKSLAREINHRKVIVRIRKNKSDEPTLPGPLDAGRSFMPAVASEWTLPGLRRWKVFHACHKK
jgi:hypothetical protein